jgi:glycosyltransferase involved in cell wall biosynthesis
LDHDDLLTPDALERVADTVGASSDIDYLYTDEDKVDGDGNHYDPFFKPDWSPERFRAQMYTAHLSVARRATALAVGGFRAGFDGAQDYDLVLRVTERARRVAHIPEVLYHWRAHDGSTALHPSQKAAAFGAAIRALTDHCERCGIDAEVQEGLEVGTYRVQRRVTSRPLVSLIVPTNGKVARVWGRHTMLVEHLINSVEALTTYDNFEYVVVHDAQMPESALTRVQQACGHPLAAVPYEYDRSSFNFSEAINRGAARSQGDVLVLLNDDMELITPDWLEQFVGLVAEPDVGAVGGKFYFEDGTIQHAGVTCAAQPYHLFYGVAPDAKFLAYPLAVTREVTALTGACMAVARDDFLAVGGFTELLPNNFNDVDFSLKLRSRELRNIWTPFVELYHFESQTRHNAVLESEGTLLGRRWGHRLYNDPYYNPNLRPIWPVWEPYEDWMSVVRGWPRVVESIFTLDPEGYLDANPDLAAVKAEHPDWDIFEHFRTHGVRERRLQTVKARRRLEPAPPLAT